MIVHIEMNNMIPHIEIHSCHTGIYTILYARCCFLDIQTQTQFIQIENNSTFGMGTFISRYRLIKIGFIHI